MFPTLNRPDGVQRFFNSYKATDATMPGVLIVDRVDYNLNFGRYKHIENAYLPSNWSLWVGAEVTMGDKFNSLLTRLLRGNPAELPLWLGMVQDDMVAETPRWDVTLISEVVDNAALFVTSADGWQDVERIGGGPPRMCGATIYNMKLLDPKQGGLGFVYPPGLPHLFNDDLLEIFANGLPGFWRPRLDVMVRSIHAIQTGEFDATHALTYNHKNWLAGTKRFEEIQTSGELDLWVAKIRNLMATNEHNLRS